MGNILDKICRENENTRFMFNNFFSEIAPFIIPKNAVETEWPQMTSQYGAHALHAGLARHGHAHAPWYPHAGTHAHTHRYQ